MPFPHIFSQNDLTKSSIFDLYNYVRRSTKKHHPQLYGQIQAGQMKLRAFLKYNTTKLGIEAGDDDEKGLNIFGDVSKVFKGNKVKFLTYCKSTTANYSVSSVMMRSRLRDGHAMTQTCEVQCMFHSYKIRKTLEHPSGKNSRQWNLNCEVNPRGFTSYYFIDIWNQYFGACCLLKSHVCLHALMMNHSEWNMTEPHRLYLCYKL